MTSKNVKKILKEFPGQFDYKRFVKALERMEEEKDKQMNAFVSSLEMHKEAQKQIAELKAENEFLKKTLRLYNPKINIQKLKGGKNENNEPKDMC